MKNKHTDEKEAHRWNKNMQFLKKKFYFKNIFLIFLLYNNNAFFAYYKFSIVSYFYEI